VHGTTAGNSSTKMLKLWEENSTVSQHFLRLIGTYIPRQCLLYFPELGWETRELSHLDLPFSEEEVLAIIKGVLKDKASGSDGFIGAFFASCWETIKGDILQAIHQFYLMNQQDLYFLNQAYVVLIPKKNDPKKVSDYRPISLTYSFSKLLSKLMANRLARELDYMISVNQTAFIKKRCKHDNFMYV
jgi:hypothetical protein